MITRPKDQRKEKTQKSNLDKPIQLREAEMFKASFKYPAFVSIALSGPRNNEIHYKSKKDKSQCNDQGW